MSEGPTNFSHDKQRFVVDLAAMGKNVAAMREQVQQRSGSGVSIVRATARVVHNTKTEVRTGRFIFHTDEPQIRGGTDSAPSPMQYFAAGVAT